MNDLTVVYYTANVIKEAFAQKIRNQLVSAIGYAELIAVSHKSLDTSVKNIVVDSPRSHIGIYLQALRGVKEAKTKYIAFAEDDVLYSPDHFKYRPTPGKFAYNANSWSIYTWVRPAMFSFKIGRRNHCFLICERDLYIETMEERFKKFENTPVDQIPLHTWAEPGRYEGNLGLTLRETESFTCQPPNIMFSHEDALSFQNLGKRKRLGDIRALSIPYWGTAEEILGLYE